jgi:hypothetical protein
MVPARWPRLSGAAVRAAGTHERFKSHMAGSSITELAKGRLYALHNAYELDGRASSYPASARGFTSSNCYLLVEKDGAIMLDSGYPVHAPSILAQLGSLIGPDHPLSMFPLRMNEFMSVCNVNAIAERFNVVECYSPVPEVHLWVDFSAKSLNGHGASNGSAPRLNDLKTTLVQGAMQRLEVGRNGQRYIDAITAPIRLIGTRWSYDHATKTLFSSDMFTHVWRDNPDGPWVVEDGKDTSTYDHVRSFLLNTRYWWLEGAKTESLRRGLGNLFDKYDVETLAPGYGCILRGRKNVEREYKIMDDILRKLDRTVTQAKYVPLGLER